MKQQSLRLNVKSESDALKWVLVHEPGLEIDRLTIGNREQFLFEDIPYLPQMQKEHRAFVKELENQGVHVLQLRDLLFDILQLSEVRSRLVRNCCAANLQPSLPNILLDDISPDELTNILLHGITVNELKDKTGRDFTQIDDFTDPFLLRPSPNIYFTRDIAAIISDSIISCKMHYPTRTHESLIIREIFRNHKLFADSKFLFGNIDGEDRPYTIEGGDIIVLSNKAIAIGRSERTRSETIAMVATNLFQNDKVQRVYEVNIPSRREYMHLDTVFTVAAPGVVVAYPGVMEHVTEIRRYEPMAIGLDDNVIAFAINENRNFNTILEDEFEGHLDVIHTGDNDPKHAEREQRADGTNVLAIKPGTVITYDRNPKTNNALRSYGFQVIEIQGSELVRGLGGPRCMTMPLVREEINNEPN